MKLGTAWSVFLLCLIASASVHAQNRKLSGLARIDLFGASSVGSLNNGRIVMGDGSIDRQGWRSALEQPRSFSVPSESFVLNGPNWAFNLFRKKAAVFP